MRSIRIVGPGRAGTSLARALDRKGWDVAPLLGRDDDLSAAAQGVDVLAIATSDQSIAQVAADVTPNDQTLVIHLSGSLGLEVLEPHERRASMHPLMTLPDPSLGAERLISSIGFAVEGDRGVEQVVSALGGQTLHVAPEDRALYHAAAAIASNHLVALAGQVERIANEIGVPMGAYLELMRASLDNVRSTGSAADALTGPAARGDLTTIWRHLDALPEAETDLYLALARESMKLAGRDPDLLREKNR